MADADVSAVLVFLNTRAEADQRLAELRAQRGVRLEIVAVDNGSTDGTRELLAAQEDVHLIANPENHWLSPAWAQGIRASSAPYVLLLTSDLRLPEPEAVATLARALDDRPRAALAGPRLVDDEGNDSRNGAFSMPTAGWVALDNLGLTRLLRRNRLPAPLPASEEEVRAVVAVNGACMLARRSALEAIGGLDERYKLYWEEIDLAHRLRDAGFEILLVSAVVGVHPGKTTPTRPGTREEAWGYGERIYFRTHHGAAAEWLVRSTRLLGGLARRGARWAGAVRSS